ncbi:MAG: PIN domain-containing protein [Candidatus Micrarchaeota archaeon]|nr:PIN domain-containing protein [Candidatus Micrarchaeota archaeon]
MLELIVDANILFSALLAKSATRALIFNSQLKLYSPEYLLSELDEHLKSDNELKEKLKQTNEETNAVIHELIHNINIFPISEYAIFVKRAIEICPDEYDAPYFALALKLKCQLWSNDKRLKKQQIIGVLNTSELISLLNQ